MKWKEPGAVLLKAPGSFCGGVLEKMRVFYYFCGLPSTVSKNSSFIIVLSATP
jgi:hypothetical protein